MKKLLVTGSIIIGLVLLFISYVYFTHTAGSLPHYFPGYEAGYNHVHAKHGIASLIVAIAFFIYAWFKSGPSGSPANPT